MIADPDDFCQTNGVVPLNVEPQRAAIVTSNTPAGNQLTIPSLWWAEEQYDPFNGKLVTDWIANRNLREIDLIVNRQVWGLMDYIDRYSFVSKFGAVARDYNYDLRVFNQQRQCLAIYRCDYAIGDLPDCRIDFNRYFQQTLQP